MSRVDKNYEGKQSSSGRSLGRDLPVSIGTSIPLEIETDLEEPSFDIIMINLETLFRNFYSSWSKDSRPPIQRMLAEWIEEVEVIQSLIRSMGVRLVIYISDYSKALRHWPNAVVSENKSPAQALYTSSLRIALNAVKSSETITVVEMGLFLTPIKGSVYIMTHQVIDLLSYGGFEDMTLLESHTGELKTPSQFASKLGTKNPRMMFNHFTLIVFGDKGKLFKAIPIGYRKEVERIAELKLWKPTTTHDKILFDLKENADKNKLDVLVRLLTKRPSIPGSVKLN